MCQGARNGAQKMSIVYEWIRGRGEVGPGETCASDADNTRAYTNITPVGSLSIACAFQAIIIRANEEDTDDGQE